ncbi:hypothetical protein [Okeania sp. KiyG1]|uniref:hypothetical protein n=1 Tax=Okeania sp. KiyG1 TaxID=2720165 RepID=UPI0019243370|nr:hypothetical protein [Okeania sp. KiyG1]
MQKWGEITVNCANSLIRNQEFNQEDWQKIYGEWQDNWANKKDQSSKTSQVKYYQKKQKNLIINCLILTTPILTTRIKMMYFIPQLVMQL